MNKNFLLTYSFENFEGMHDSNYAWFETEEEMRNEIEFFMDIYKDFEINEMFEIINGREVEL